MNNQYRLFSSLLVSLRDHSLSMSEGLGKAKVDLLGTEYEAVLTRIYAGVFQNGESITVQMKLYPELFCPEVIDSIKQGEASGELIRSLEQCVAILEQE